LILGWVVVIIRHERGYFVLIFFDYLVGVIASELATKLVIALQNFYLATHVAELRRESIIK
jgi:hypothetical protein